MQGRLTEVDQGGMHGKVTCMSRRQGGRTKNRRLHGVVRHE